MGGVIGYNQHLIKEKLNYKFSLIKKEVALLSRLNTLGNQNSKDTTCLDVLCIGNSITLHPIKEDIEWYSDWGMAASKKENDYVHLLEKMLQVNNPKSKVTPKNIWEFENNPSIDLDSLIGKEIEGKNAVVIRIGENVKDLASFSANLPRLINYCKAKVDKVIITGNFWPNADKEEVILNAAIQTKIKYIPLSWISTLFDVFPEIGDTLYNNDYQPYTINKDFIITHPDDKGMRMIAEEIYKAF